jgi:hypothetical protein
VVCIEELCHISVVVFASCKSVQVIIIIVYIKSATLGSTYLEKNKISKTYISTSG